MSIGVNIEVIAFFLSGINISKSRTTIDIAANITSTAESTTTVLRTDVHCHITSNDSSLTLTTTIDVAGNITAGHVNLGITKHVGCVTATKDIDDG